MKFSESWLRTWVNPNISTEQLVDQLTMAGLEVDGVEAVAGSFKKVVVGEILEVVQHPDADKLRVCQVAGSPDGTQQVVCGAPNARVGIKIPFALVGAELPPGENGKAFKIKKAKLRGVESFGMLCGETELQVGDDDSGLMELAAGAAVGMDFREYLDLNDTLIEVDLTPNRSDCLSLKGLAREVGVLNRCDVEYPVIEPVAPQSDDSFLVVLEKGAGCARYAGRVIKGVDVTKPSPLWMQERLRRSGIRSIDAIVDVTNYILLEQGQPMHAFDLNKLHRGIQARKAKKGEKLRLLDGQEVELTPETLVIADANGPVAMAGIMGGEPTSVTKSTTDIFLESAFFAPVVISGRARSYGLHTDSSHRFERGVDYNGAVNAIERATQLLLEIVGGQPGPVVCEDLAEELPAQASVNLNRARIEQGLGFAMSDADVVDIISRLGMELTHTTEQGWTFLVPSYRFDISIEEDLLEELARIYGYNNLPSTRMRVTGELPLISENRLPEDRVARHLIGRGYQEAITYSFIDPKLHKAFEGGDAVELLNPISADMSLMRTSLVPGLVDTLVRNLNRQHSRVRLFEKGLRFVPTPEGLSQTVGLAGLLYGPRFEASWGAEKGDVDFYDLKGDLESLFALSTLQIEYVPSQRPAMHPGQCADVVVDGDVVGFIAALHPAVQKSLDVPKPVFVFEFDLKVALQASVPSFKPLSKFPGVGRDLAIVVDKSVSSATIEKEIRSNAGDYLKKLKVFDVYSGEGIDPKRKSLAFSLTFQHPSRTLNEDEINAAVATIVKRLEEGFDANLR